MLFALSHYKCKSYGVVAPGPLRRSWIWNSVSVSDREVSVVSQPSLSLTHTCTCAHAHIYFVCLFQALSHLCWTQPSHRSKSKAILPSVKMFSILPYGFIFMLLTSAHWSVSKCSPVKSCISGKGSTSWGRCWVVSNLLTVRPFPLQPPHSSPPWRYFSSRRWCVDALPEGSKDYSFVFGKTVGRLWSHE